MEQVTVPQLLAFAPDCQRISAEHGFWDEGEARSKAEMVALINSELYEAMGGHRKGKKYVKSDTEIDPNTHWVPYLDYVHEQRDYVAYGQVFELKVKDTIDDEMADTVIRVLDYVHGWEIPVVERWYRKESTGNFAHDILRINWYVINAFHQSIDKDWGYVLAAIIKFCEWYQIDIITHVQWKMRYNAGREHKHGKSY